MLRRGRLIGSKGMRLKNYPLGWFVDQLVGAGFLFVAVAVCFFNHDISVWWLASGLATS